ncbi:MAG: Ig domain-containing protein, partial [Spirochaetes bacterium]|nr:Ig domain-containing protein [Spirochaetota bacterium]
MKPLQVIIKTAIVVISILAMAGCGSGSGGSNGDGDVITDTVSATGVTLNRETLTMAVSDTYQLTATVTPDNAGNKTVSWSSNTTSVATVDENGLVTALAVGSATITVTTEDGDYSDSCVVTVMTDPIPVTGVDLNTETLTIDVGDTYQLTAMVIPDNASNKTVSWSSDTDSVATVDQNGTVTAVAEGTATITVISEEGEHSDSCEVTVTPVDVIGITLDRETLALSINDTFQLAATIVPNNATNKNVTWSTGAASVATVDQNGLVTALAQGTAVITVTTEDGGHTDSCTITVIAVYDEGAFITVWDLSLSTIPTPLLLIPLNSTGNYDFTIDWGDGTVETYSGLVHNDVDHEYTDKGVYTVVITGI